MKFKIVFTVLMLLVGLSPLLAITRSEVLFQSLRYTNSHLSSDDREQIASFVALPFSEEKGGFVDELGKPVEIALREEDLNGDSVPEVLVFFFNPYLYGATGGGVILLKKNVRGKYETNFDIPACEVEVAETRTKGFKDLRIIGRGAKVPLWRWNGETYEFSHHEISRVSEFQIASRQVGDFRIGANIDDLITSPRKLVAATKEVYEEGEGLLPVSFSNLFIGKERVLEVYFNEKVRNVAELLVVSPTFKTSKGIGVGATLKEFVAAYPKYRLWYTYVTRRFIVETPELENVQFLVDNGSYKGSAELLTDSPDMDVPIKRFKPNARIKEVRVY